MMERIVNPFLTPDLPGTGGRIRSAPEDFRVDEVPLYEPCGEGTHRYLFLEKKGLPTLEAVGLLARALKRRPDEFGVAGLKDADAVTRQWISIEHVSREEVERLDLDRVEILKEALHSNKLKMGHLKGNRFRIKVRGTCDGAAERAEAVIGRLKEKGVPNFYGPQRFGLFHNTHRLGEAILKREFETFADVLVCTPRPDEGYDEVIRLYKDGDYQGALQSIGRRYKYERRVLEILSNRPGRFDRAAAGIDKRMLKFYFSAFQSHLFNQYLARRIECIDRLEEGEIAFLHRNGASFVVEDASLEAPRAQAFEISPSGPIYGKKMLKARGRPGELERTVLDEAGFTLDQIKGLFGIRLFGARRPLRVPLEACGIEEDGDGLTLSFFLPHGSYATVLLREVTKCDEK
jgi:tRNA pseudouridine13 synthase